MIILPVVASNVHTMRGIFQNETIIIHLIIQVFLSK